MSVYTIAATADLGTISQTITDIKPGDEIVTHGYYSSGDGGGARFRVKQDLAAESSHFEYTLVNTADKQIKAVMIIEDGTVNIDQLGAKGDAVLPLSFNDSYSNPESCDMRTIKTLNINNGSSEYLDENEVAITATDNAKFFNEAISNSEVHCIRLTAGKIYGTKSTINMQSNKVLDGNSATIMYINTTPLSGLHYLINCRNSGTAFNENIEIMNVRLIHNAFISDDYTYRAIYIQHCRNVDIHDVTIERSHVGIKSTASKKGTDYNTVSIRNVHILDVYTGLEIGDIMNSLISDSYISCDYNLLLSADKANGKHCIYAGGAMKDCVFKNLTLRNAGKGNAINRNEALDSFDYFGENLLFSNIIIDNCDCAVHVGKRTRNSVFKNIIATNVMESGIALCGAEDVLITNCSFKSMDEAACGISVPSDSKELDYIKNVIVDNCKFDFNRKFISIGSSRILFGDSLIVKNCYFHIFSPQMAQASTPALVKGIVSNVTFIKCVFEAERFFNDSHSQNGVFFYFTSDRNKEMHWTFDRCKFINNGSVTVNSPVLSNSMSDEMYNNVVTKKVHCTMKNCTLVNFRWTIRVSTTGDDKSSDTNPCFYPPGAGNNVSVDTAVNAMNNKQRFIAINNIHQYNEIIDGFNTTHYVKGVDFGI
ncbi:MAG: hypothetical protein IJB86_07905 [Clostridia bacterium]|nr:hypothetical protein [Clostridia bacterium]